MIDLFSKGAFGLVYNKFSSNPDVQKMSIGLSCLYKAKNWLYSNEPDSISRKERVFQKIVGVGLGVAGLACICYGLSSLIASSPIQNSRLEKTTDIYESKFPDCRADAGDRNILLLTARSTVDHVGAFDPTRSFSLNNCFCKLGNLTQKVISTPLEICTTIAEASKEKPLDSLVIGAHGDPARMLLSPNQEFRVFDLLPANCFKGLSSTANIILASCSVGAQRFLTPNLAEWMSWISGKPVISPSLVSDARLQTCFAENGMIKMNFSDVFRMSENGVDSYGIRDVTKQTNVLESGSQVFRFGVHMFFPTVFKIMILWNGAYLGGKLIQGVGFLGESAVKKVRNYQPYAADITIGLFQMIHRVGSAITDGMDWVYGNAIRPLF